MSRSSDISSPVKIPVCRPSLMTSMRSATAMISGAVPTSDNAFEQSVLDALAFVGIAPTLGNMLGIMLFGRERVGEKLHMFATAMVAFGTLMSATWILSVNSWMQTPAGYSINDVGQFVPEDWWQIVFNPSFPYRLVHMVLAAFLTTSLVVGAVGALHLLRDKTDKEARRMFSMAMWMAAIVTPLQIYAGDLHGLNTLEHQPAKIMAMEGHYDSHPDGAPLILFGIPNPEEKRIDYAIEVPKLSSLILKHHWDAPLDGLDTIPDDEEPPVAIVFWSFRIMVGLGFAMLGLGAWSLFARWKGRLYDTPWLHRSAILMGPTGFIAVLAGWITTEVGRQPFTVYGLLRTSDSLAPVDAPAVATSLLAFIIVYFFVFGAGKGIQRIAKAIEDVLGDHLTGGHVIDIHRLEPAFERLVLLDVLPVLVQRRRADGSQLTPGQHRLQQIRRVHGPLGGAGAAARASAADSRRRWAQAFPLVVTTIQAIPSRSSCRSRSTTPGRLASIATTPGAS